MRPIRVLLAIAITLSAVVGGVMLRIGLQHNAQGELFYPGTEIIDVGYACLIFASWFIVTLAVLVVPPFIVIAGANLVERLCSRRK